MKTAKITATTTLGVPMPAEFENSSFGGLRLTITKMSSNGKLILPPQIEAQWMVPDWVEGETYSVLIESVNTDGQVVNAPPPIVVTTPSGGNTYTRVDGISVDFVGQGVLPEPVTLI